MAPTDVQRLVVALRCRAARVWRHGRDTGVVWTERQSEVHHHLLPPRVQATHGYTALTVRVRRDDGVVLYVNGTQVARSNMPGGTIRYNTLASTPLSGGSETTFVTIPIAASLVKGTNVIAAEVHQVERSSSDIVFDLELTGIGNTGPLA